MPRGEQEMPNIPQLSVFSLPWATEGGLRPLLLPHIWPSEALHRPPCPSVEIVYGNFFHCLAQLSNYKKEGLINQWGVEDHPQFSPNKGMDRTIDALTTKKKMKMESH